MSQKTKFTYIDRYTVKVCDQCDGEGSLPVDAPFMTGVQDCSTCKTKGYTVIYNKWAVLRTLILTISVAALLLITPFVWFTANSRYLDAAGVFMFTIVAMLIAEFQTRYLQRLAVSLKHLWKDDKKELDDEIGAVLEEIERRAARKEEKDEVYRLKLGHGDNRETALDTESKEFKDSIFD